jgi:hypothetical protein
MTVAGGPTNYLSKKQYTIADAIHTFVGDVLLYQGCGAQIREFIYRRICEEAEIAGPIVILAHSLGGIASVDLLASGDFRDLVHLLVTIGSQTPVLYEMGALQSLAPGQGLPADFPPWINIYDRADFLSYAAAGVFGSDYVTDMEINSRQPLWHAHGAYWENPRVWEVILGNL